MKVKTPPTKKMKKTNKKSGSLRKGTALCIIHKKFTKYLHIIHENGGSGLGYQKFVCYNPRKYGFVAFVFPKTDKFGKLLQ